MASRALKPYSPYRQLTIDFDFVEAEFKAAEAKRLHAISIECRNHEDKWLVQGVDSILTRGHLYAEAKVIFGKSREEHTWPEYCKRCLGYTRQTVEKHIGVWQALGQCDKHALAGVDPAAFALLARRETTKVQLNRVLKAAEKDRLPLAEVKKLLGIEDKQKIEFKADLPESDDALKTLLSKKIDSVRKRCTDELAHHVPDLLRVIADELNGEQLEEAF